MSKLPSLQFYPGDWRKDAGVQALDYFTRGVWFEILMLMHESEERGVLLLNGQKMPDEALAQAVGIPVDLLKQTTTKILEYGVASLNPDSGALVCRRMVRDEKLRKIRQKAGKLGGNPVLLKQNPTTRVKQNPTPSVSSSSSSSSSDSTPPTPSVKRDGLAAFEAFWKAYPKKVKRGDAEHAFVEVGGVQEIDNILSALEWQCQSESWTDEGGKYIPGPSNYLRDKRWMDEQEVNGARREIPEEEHTTPHMGDKLYHFGKRTWSRDSQGPQKEDFPGREDLFTAIRIDWDSWIKVPERKDK